MFCALSGEPMQEPVASKKSGQVFEKRLIEAYIAQHGKDPTNGDELQSDDLVALKTSNVVSPRPPNMTSIPALMNALQSEWDAQKIDGFNMHQEVLRLRSELAEAKWSNKAAELTVKRLQSELNESKSALAKIPVAGAKAPSTNGASSDVMQVDDDGPKLPKHLVDEVTAAGEKYTANRKRPLPDDYASSDRIKMYKSVKQVSPAVSAGSRALSLSKSGNYMLVGGYDGRAAIYSVRKQEVVGSFEAGNTGVNSVASIDYDEDNSKLAALFGFEDGNIKLMHFDATSKVVQAHHGAVTSVTVHPSRALAASVGKDKRVVIYDLEDFEKVHEINTGSALTLCAFHPEGQLLAVGTESGNMMMLKTTNLDTQATYSIGGPVHAMSFSQTGLWLAMVARGSSEVQIQDLRKEDPPKRVKFSAAISSVEFDLSAQYLLSATAAAVETMQYDKRSKTWSPLAAFAGSAGNAKWGPLAKGLAILKGNGGINIMK